MASGGGTSLVTALAESFGGDAGTGTTRFGDGGGAVAAATGTGLGPVEATASAVGGASDGLSGSGLATATATGSSGFARALAETGETLDEQVRVSSQATVASRRDVAARATYGTALADAPDAAGLEGMAFATGDALAADVQHALAGNDALADLFADPGAEMVALARWSGVGDGGDNLELFTRVDIVLGEAEEVRELALGAFDITAVNDEVFELRVAAAAADAPDVIRTAGELDRAAERDVAIGGVVAGQSLGNGADDALVHDQQRAGGAALPFRGNKLTSRAEALAIMERDLAG